MRIGPFRLAAHLLLVFTAVVVGQAPAQSIDLFDAKATGQIEAKFIPKDSTRATIIITNKTAAPLSIELPEVFAGVPVLAQRFGGGGGGGFGGGGGGQQGVGGGGGGGGLGGGGGGFGGGGGGRAGGGGAAFNVEPGAVGKFKVPLVCLEHGKAEPKPKIPYEMVPVEAMTTDPIVVAILQMLGNGQIDQRAAQAATWHLTDGLSWQELADKVKIEHLNGTREMFFTPAQLAAATQIVAEANRRAVDIKLPTRTESIPPAHVSPSAG